MAQVLVADDNPLSRAFFGEAIGLGGHHATMAADGVQAVALATDRAFGLILLDNRMPGLDGPAALRRIRDGMGPSCDAPAVATSADAGIGRRGFLDAGFAEVLIKPVGVDVLRALLDRYLGPPQPLLLDDVLALEKAGGDESILAALRRLLAGELEELPAEITRFAEHADHAALRERLHRLEASAGFCATPLLARAIASLRTALEAGPAWPGAALEEFLEVCRRTHLALH